MFYWKDLVIRKRLLFVTLICALPLMVNGCISTEPVYVESIEVYKNGELLEEKLQYYDGTLWVDYDNKTNTKQKIYYSVDIRSDDI